LTDRLKVGMNGGDVGVLLNQLSALARCSRRALAYYSVCLVEELVSGIGTITGVVIYVGAERLEGRIKKHSDICHNL